MSRFSVFGVSFALHAYVGLRLVPPLSAWPAAAAVLAAVVLLSAVLVPMSFAGARLRGARLRKAVVWGGFLCMGLFSTLFVLTLARDGVLLVAWALALFGVARWPPLATLSAAAVALGAFGITLIGFVNARRTAAVRTVEVPIDGLPDALHGFTIAQITDLHVGPTIRRGQVEAIVERVNRLQADMVAITGDLVDGSVPDLGEHVAPLGRLASRHGSFLVTGNHEYYAGATAWIAEFRRLGLHVLLDAHTVLRHGDATVVVGGVTDSSSRHFDPTHRSDPHAAMAGAPADAGVRVLLAHQPRSAFEAQAAGFDVQLSGHTHGGQFLPWTWFVRFQQPFTAGLHRVQGLWVYISRGTGYWGPPKRFGAPSEITRLRLVPAPAPLR